MIGAIIGDIAGSRFEFCNHKSKDFELLAKDCFFTDDTIVTLALAKAVLLSGVDYEDLSTLAVQQMRKIGGAYLDYPGASFGERFGMWLYFGKPEPYNSFGNGAAMRISVAGDVARNIEECKWLSKTLTEVTHNHPEGLKGAEAVATAIFLAKNGMSKEDLKAYIDDKYYDMDFSLDQIRESYTFDVSCQGSVPQALMSFFESTDFEDAVRNAISIGGDSDTIGAICGSVAGAYYGVPAEIKNRALGFLDERLLKIYEEFEMSRGQFMVLHNK